MGSIRRVTLMEVAAQAGVSLTTVSKVLNGGGDVSSATRTLVEEHLQRSGYRRRGSQRRREYIEIVLHKFDRDWAVAIVDGVRETAAREGMAVSLVVSGDHRTPAPDWMEAVLRRRPTGVILLFAGVPEGGKAKLAARGIPFVVIDPAGDPDPDVPAIGAANWSGGVSATRHLIDLGHRRIAAISGPESMMCAVARLDGYRAAMSAAVLPVDPDHVQFGDFLRGGGERHAARILRLADPPTAIFAGSDLQALGVLHAAAEVGLRVPKDLSVVGFDDVAIAELAKPRLTTVHQPLREMAVQATRLVLDLAAGTSPESTRVELATRLVVRDSTAAPRDSR